MSRKGKLRLFGAGVLLVNMWAIGHFGLGQAATLLLTFGFAIAFEMFSVRAIDKGGDPAPAAWMTVGACWLGIALMAVLAPSAPGPTPTSAASADQAGLLAYPIDSLTDEQFTSAQAEWQQAHPEAAALTTEMGGMLSVVYHENRSIPLGQALDEALRRVQRSKMAPGTSGPEPIVDRGTLGGCPTGYIDHPADPKKCALPIVAERMLSRVSRRRSGDDD